MCSSTRLMLCILPLRNSYFHKNNTPCAIKCPYYSYCLQCHLLFFEDDITCFLKESYVFLRRTSINGSYLETGLLLKNEELMSIWMGFWWKLKAPFHFIFEEFECKSRLSSFADSGSSKAHDFSTKLQIKSRGRGEIRRERYWGREKRKERTEDKHKIVSQVLIGRPCLDLKKKY